MKTPLLRAAAIAAAISVSAPPVSAQDVPLAPSPSFKKVGVPSKASGRRITVQIDPEQDWYRRKPGPEVVEEAEPEPDRRVPGDVYAGFWSAISPRLSDSAPDRLDAALAALSKTPGLKGPRLDDMRRITEAYGREILRHTVGTRVSPALVAAIISVESAGRVDAVSSAGAQGVMQLMPATAARFGVTDWKVASENIRGGIAYLDWLTGHFDYDPLMILAGYNAGEGAVREHQGVPPYAETRAYVPKVLAAWKVAAGLCRTPPQFISDGCAFVGG